MNAYERMLDLIEREIASTGENEWSDEDVQVRIRQIEASDKLDASHDEQDAPESLSDSDCQRIVSKVLHHRQRAPGGGRKPIYDAPMVDRMIRLPQQAIHELEIIGDGNVSAGVRTLWEWWRSTR